MNVTHAKITAAVVVWVVAILQIFGIEYHLYWVYPPFDIIMHFLGGFFVGAVLIWITLSKKIPLSKRFFIVFILIGTFIIGILWEIFEMIFNIQDVFSAVHIEDTLIDLLMDILGGFGVLAFLSALSKKYE